MLARAAAGAGGAPMCAPPLPGHRPATLSTFRPSVELRSSGQRQPAGRRGRKLRLAPAASLQVAIDGGGDRGGEGAGEARGARGGGRAAALARQLRLQQARGQHDHINSHLDVHGVAPDAAAGWEDAHAEGVGCGAGGQGYGREYTARAAVSTSASSCCTWRAPPGRNLERSMKPHLTKRLPGLLELSATPILQRSTSCGAHGCKTA